jgi:hypothetical protein
MPKTNGPRPVTSPIGEDREVASPALDEALATAHAVINDDALSPEGRVRTILDRIAHTEFRAPGAADAMVGSLRQFSEVAKGLRMNCDGRALIVEAAKLFQRSVELSRPVLQEAASGVPRSVNDITDTARRGLAACGWSQLEVDWLVIALMQSKQILGSWTAREAISTTGAHISRQALRENAAPRNEYRDRFLASLPAIPAT